MYGKWLKKRVGLILILFFCFSFFVFGQDKQDEQDKQLREEILSIYNAKGEEGLCDFMKKQGDKISNKFITDFAETGKKKRKEKWLEACVILAEEKKDEETLADVYYNMGTYFRLISENKKAFDCFDKALAIYLKANNSIGQGDVYLSKGAIYFNFGEYSRAVKMYDKALLFLKKGGDIVGQGNVYHCKGDIYFYTGDNSKAIEMYDKALPFFEKSRDFLGRGNVYMSKGDIYFFNSDNSRALEMYNKALLFFEKAEEPISQGNTYERKGDIYTRVGDNARAFEMYDKALQFFKKAGNIIGQGNVYYCKGRNYSLTGDNLKALEMYNKALPFFEKAAQPDGQGNIYFRKGDIYLYTGNNSRAIEMYDKALPFFKKARDPIGQGNVYLGKGDIYFYSGNNSRALEMYDKALLFFEKMRAPIGQGNVYVNKGYYYLYTGKTSQAFEMYGKALPFFEKIGYPLGQGIVYKSRGDFYLYLGDISKSIEMYDKALLFFEKAGAIGPKSYTLHAKAKVLLILGEKNEAMDLFVKGIVYLERVRGQTAFSEMKKTFMEEVYEQYKETAIFMLANEYNKKGFKYAESMKARGFLDRMREGLMNLDKGLPTELKKQHDELIARLSSLKSKIYETARGKGDQTLQELKEKYRSAENEFEELLIKIRLEHRPYASIKYPEPISIRELQKEVLKNDEILLRYFIAPEKLYVFLVSKNDFKVVPLNIGKEKLNGLVKEYFTALKENDAQRLGRFGKYLYKELIQPLEEMINENQTIILVPDGKLATIPFESFCVGKNASGQPMYLLEKYRVKYIQSASVLSVLREHYRWDRKTDNFIGFGNPVYDYEQFKKEPQKKPSPTPPTIEDEIKEIHRTRYAGAGGELPPLKETGEEVEAIARLFKNKSQKSVVYTRAQATEDNAKTPQMKDFDFIHFACHGLLNDDFQSLVLAQDIPGTKDDGYFTLNEIMNCDYHAKLVVLSACDTGSGKVERAEGVTGLTRAVMYAGTPAVVAGLWKVDNRAAKELMIRFYKNMLEKNMDKVEALRQAKLELIKTQRFSSPYYWSPFIMYGE